VIDWATLIPACIAALAAAAVLVITQLQTGKINQTKAQVDKLATIRTARTRSTDPQSRQLEGPLTAETKPQRLW
jgi:hypothetical protein